VRFNDDGLSLRGESLVTFLRGCELAITGLEPIDDALLDQLPDLRVISKVGVGTDMIDLDALERHGVRLALTPGTNARSVAELVVAFAVSALRQVQQSGRELRDGEWRQAKGRLLSDRTVGLVGFGAVGREVAELLRAFRCPVLAYDTAPPETVPEHVRLTGLAELLAGSEIVSLHVPLTTETRNLIDEAAIALLPEGAVLINTARGGLVDEAALYHALVGGRLAAACLDVFAVEPPVGGSLLELPNVLATPHIGGSTEEAILAMGRAAIAGLDSPGGA
jgi:phosphoglycerate dehydrogenase-like enzyme